ncbi:MAG: hypothetical protein L0H84_08070 [Pseudonocardia sp.]|nr:hypothetical protein [Pseudonocardia sp.]
MDHLRHRGVLRRFVAAMTRMLPQPGASGSATDRGQEHRPEASMDRPPGT